MTNAEWMIKNGYKFSDIHIGVRYKGYLRTGEFVVRIKNEKIDTFKSKLEFADEALKEWLDMEHVESILDDTEKRYLKGVIRPFRDRVQYITKTNNGCSRGYCGIRIGFTNPSDDIYLPCFLESTMYKGMKMYDAYSLEELGL